jgi:malonyl-ACP O-methyltransferase BioC
MDTKATVAAAFSAAADTYNLGADVQREVAEHLIERVRALPYVSHPRILEIGCGTGFLSRALAALDPSELVLTDVSEAMLARCRETMGQVSSARFLTMDGERPTLAPGFDLICSSLAFQWFDDLPAALPRLTALLNPGGYLAFATLGYSSFENWKQAFADLNIPSGMRDYPKSASLASFLTPPLQVDQEFLTRDYPNGHSFLDELKLIGAHSPEDNHRPAPGPLRRVLRGFEDGITVTYHALYGIFQA